MNNSFDDQLRKQWEEQHFPVDDQHRQEMLTLLEGNRRRKGIFWWFGGLALALTLVGGILYFTSESKIQAPAAPLPDSSTIISSDVVQLPKTNTGDANSIISGEEKSSTITTDVTSSKDISAAAGNQDNAASSHADTKKLGVAKRSRVNKTDRNVEKQKDDNATKQDIFTSSPDMIKKDLLVIPNTSPAIVSQAVAVVVYPEDVEIIPSDELEQRNDYVTEPVADIFFSEIDYTTFNKMQAISPSRMHHALNIFAESGLGFIPGVINKYKAGWTFSAGVGAGYKVRPKAGIILSGGYLLQNEGFDFVRTSTVTQLDFGIRSNSNTLQPDKLHFIYTKLGLQFEMKRHLLSVFGGLQYLYGAQGNIIIKSTDQFSLVPEEESRYTWLNTDGMRKIFWNSEIAYGYRLSPRMNISAGMKYNFSSIKLEDEALRNEGYFWKGYYSAFSPTFTIKYHLYGKR